MLKTYFGEWGTVLFRTALCNTFCTKEVLDMLQEKGLIDIDEAFIKKFGLLPF